MPLHTFLYFIVAEATDLRLRLRLRLRFNITDQLEEEEDVYDLVEEDQYAKMVEERRNSNNFVVDDSKYKFTKSAYFLIILY